MSPPTPKRFIGANQFGTGASAPAKPMSGMRRGTP